ncbi:hypothetical protein H0H87_000690 [Tephrocybe sp. NHM501043]|nr:hypothetical protein H0H87_000690 [Tephrocybe sp. NHM501043]
MPPRKDTSDKFIAVDSDSDISIDDDADDHPKSNKGKGKASDPKRKRDGKGKGKAKDTVLVFSFPTAPYLNVVLASLHMGGILHPVMGDRPGGRGWKPAKLRGRLDGAGLLAPSTAIRRTIIRHLVLLLDLSAAMMDRDMRPTRFDLMLQYTREFIAEWFDQNPLGQIGIVGMRAGIGERIGEMSGNPQEVLKHIADRHKLEPTGEPSLQNSIEMARSSMNHLPTHSSREIIIIFGSLTTCDPGNIHDTLDACVKAKIRISVVALAAEMKICRSLCEKSGGQFGVAINEGHFHDLLFELIPPPAQQATVARVGAGANANARSANPSADLMLMGFPTRLPDTAPPGLCVCHSEIKSEGFLCPRCLAKVCDVPTDCDTVTYSYMTLYIAVQDVGGKYEERGA